MGKQLGTGSGTGLITVALTLVALLAILAFLTRAEAFKNHDRASKADAAHTEIAVAEGFVDGQQQGGGQRTPSIEELKAKYNPDIVDVLIAEGNNADAIKNLCELSPMMCTNKIRFNADGSSMHAGGATFGDPDTTSKTLMEKPNFGFNYGVHTYNPKIDKWSHFPWSDGKNYLRGDVIIDGNTTANGQLRVNGAAAHTGGVVAGNPSAQTTQEMWGFDKGLHSFNADINKWSHFPWKDGKNYLRGDVIIDAGDLHANKLCLGNTCVTEAELQRLTSAQASAPSAPAAPAAPEAMVTIRQHCISRDSGDPGWSVDLTPGKYRLGDFAGSRFRNDDASSVSILKDGAVVILFEHDNFEGRFIVIEKKHMGNKGEACLGDFNFNDVASSVVVLAPGQYKPDEPLVEISDRCVQDSRGQGWTVKLGMGSYWMNDLEAKGVKNDETSFVKILKAGARATLYEHANVDGDYKLLPVDGNVARTDTCLPDLSFDNTMSSMVVIPPLPLMGPGVIA